MISCSIGSFAYRLGRQVPISEMSMSGKYEADISQWLDVGLTHVSEISGDLKEEIIAAGKESLSKSSMESGDIDFVVFCGEFHHSNQWVRKSLQAILNTLDLGDKARVLISGNGSGDVFAGVEAARDRMNQGGAKCCLILSAFQQPVGGSRFAKDGRSILSDGVISFVLSLDGTGDLALSEFIRIDHSDWADPGNQSRENSLTEFVEVMKSASAQLMKNGGDKMNIDHVTVMLRSDTAMTFPQVSKDRILKSKFSVLNLVVAGGPFLEIANAIEQDDLKVGETIMINAPTPHSYFGMLLKRH